MQRKGRLKSTHLLSSASESSSSDSNLALNPDTANRYSNNSSTPEILRYISAASHIQKSHSQLIRSISEPNHHETETSPQETNVDNTLDINDLNADNASQEAITPTNETSPDLEASHVQIIPETDDTTLLQLETLAEAETATLFQQLKLLISSKYLNNEPEIWTFCFGWALKFVCSLALHEYMSFVPAFILGVAIGSVFAFAIHGTVKDTIAFMRNPPREIIPENNVDIELQSMAVSSTLSP